MESAVDIRDIALRLIGEDHKSLQSFCDRLSQELSQHEENLVPISLYSQCMHDRSIASLICSSSAERPINLSINELNSISISIKTPFHPAPLFMLTANDFWLPHLKSIENVLTKILTLIVFRKRQSTRKFLVDISNTTGDANSFTYKILSVIRRNIVYCDEVSIFLRDEVLQRLVLSASTIRFKGIKDSHFYMLGDDSPVPTCAKEHRPVMFYRDGKTQHLPSELLSMFGVTSRTASLILWPIRYMDSDGEEGGRAESEVLGVIQITGIRRKHDSRQWPTFISRFDLVFVNFLSEMIFVIVRQYQQAHKSEHDYAKLTHGIKTTLLSSAKKLKSLRKMLFVEDQSSSLVDYRFKLLSTSSERDRELEEFARKHALPPPRRLPTVDRQLIYREFNNIQSTLDDTNFQLQRVMGHRGEDLPVSSVRLMQDVLMPVVRMYESYAVSSSEYPPPLFNKLTAENFNSAPPVLSNADALVSVFRNLVENSIKYTDHGRATINISYRIEKRMMTISYKDRGIGIGQNEHELIFNEGYRSVLAMRTDNRGIGHGLSYCKDVLQSMSAGIRSEPAVHGAHFLLTLPLA